VKISTEIASWMQHSLLGVNGEYWGVGYMADGIPNAPGGAIGRWQLGVDMIYRTMTCDLIAVQVFVECQDRTSFLRAIRTVSPYEDLGGFLWNGTQIYGTERLSKLVNAHFPPTGEVTRTLNPAFVEALEQVFAENGVPWSDKPLLPIMPTTASAPAASR
jgi:hypothetical protein